MMEARKDREFPLFELTTGDFGLVETKARFTNAFFDGKPAIDKRIERFSCDGVLLTEIIMVSSINNLKERLYLTLKGEIDRYYYRIVLSFKNHSNNYEIAGSFVCNFGEYGNPTIFYPTTADTYAKARKKIVEICNPDYAYKIDDIVDLLRECNSEELNNAITEHWDDVTGKKEEQPNGAKRK